MSCNIIMNISFFSFIFLDFFFEDCCINSVFQFLVTILISAAILFTPQISCPLFVDSRLYFLRADQ